MKLKFFGPFAALLMSATTLWASPLPTNLQPISVSVNFELEKYAQKPASELVTFLDSFEKVLNDVGNRHKDYYYCHTGGLNLRVSDYSQPDVSPAQARDLYVYTSVSCLVEASDPIDAERYLQPLKTIVETEVAQDIGVILNVSIQLPSVQPPYGGSTGSNGKVAP